MCAWGILNIALRKVGMLISFAHLFSLVIKISLPRNWRQDNVMGFDFFFLLPMIFFFEMGSQCWKRVLFLFQANYFLVCKALSAYHYPPFFPPATTSAPAILLCRYHLMLLKVLVLLFLKEHPKTTKDPVSIVIKETNPLNLWNKPLIWSCNV